MSVLMGETLRKAQTRIGYNFKNVLYLWEALQAPGSVVRSGSLEGIPTTYHSMMFRRFPDGNRRLAILGDTVLKTALIEDWYKSGDARERSSRIVSDVGSNENLVRIGRTSGLAALINKNPTDMDVDAGPTTVAATVEAIIGAVYLDSDIRSVTNVMQNLDLMPKLVRRCEQQVPPVSENAKSSASTFWAQDQPGVA